jgi:hypothetical protein
MIQEYLVPPVSNVVQAPAEILFMGCSAIDARETACSGSVVCRSAVVATDSLDDGEAITDG